MLKSTNPRAGAGLVLLIAAVLLSGFVYPAGHCLRRQVSAKQEYTKLPEYSDIDHIVVKLREGISRPNLLNGKFDGPDDQLQLLNTIIESVNGIEKIRHRFSIDIPRLDKIRDEGSRRIGWPLPDLSLYYEIEVRPGISSQAGLNLINRLFGLDIVEVAYFAPRVVIPDAPRAAEFM
jgi:hypothetical protein